MLVKSRCILQSAGGFTREIKVQADFFCESSVTVLGDWICVIRLALHFFSVRSLSSQTRVKYRVSNIAFKKILSNQFWLTTTNLHSAWMLEDHRIFLDSEKRIEIKTDNQHHRILRPNYGGYRDICDPETLCFQTYHMIF